MFQFIRVQNYTLSTKQPFSQVTFTFDDVSYQPYIHFFTLFLSLFKILLYLCIQKHQFLETGYETDKTLDIPDSAHRTATDSLR